MASDNSKLTLTGVAEGTATITVTTQDSDGNSVSNDFDVSVVKKYAALIAQIHEWRNDPCCISHQGHTERWDRVLLTMGETVADTTLTPMTAAEAQGYADRGWTRWVEVAKALREIEGAGQQQQQANRAPTVSSAIDDATIVNESGTHQASLSGVFSDADNDSLTITASSSDDAKATASVSPDYATLTVNAHARGPATITVTADDGYGGTVEDTFTVTVKAAPAVASAISDVSGLEESATQDVSLSGVFSDADGDTLTVTAESSDETKATVSVASDNSKLTLTGVAEGTTTITVTAQDSDSNEVSDTFDVSVAEAPQLQQANRAPTVSNAIADVTIVNESGTHQASLSGVFSDADDDSLTIAAGSSNDAVATATVSSDYATLTVNAQARGPATITVTANDGHGGTVSDTFTVTVKAAPTVALAISDISGLEEGATQDVSLSGVYSDADGDALTVTAASSDDAKATVTVAADQSKLTVAGVDEGTATIAVTAQDTDSNRISDTFTVSVEQEQTSDGAPTVAAPLPDTSMEVANRFQHISLSGVFTDPDGDSLTLSAQSSDSRIVLMLRVRDSTLTVVARSAGTAKITVTANDPDGNTARDVFEVTVRPAP